MLFAANFAHIFPALRPEADELCAYYRPNYYLYRPMHYSVQYKQAGHGREELQREWKHLYELKLSIQHKNGYKTYDNVMTFMLCHCKCIRLVGFKP